MKIKTLRLFILMVSILVGGLLVACSVSSITQLSFVETPQEIIYNNGSGSVNAKVLITYSDGKSIEADLNQAQTYGVSVTGNNYPGPGTYTLKVSYGAITATFQYQVFEDEDGWIDNLFGPIVTINGDEYYQIYDATQLYNIRHALHKNFKLASNIDLSEIDWVPIGKVTIEIINPNNYKYIVEEGFSGKFNGYIDPLNPTNGVYEISGLTIPYENSSDAGAGLFIGIKGTSGNNASIDGLKLTNININSKAAAAPLGVTVEYANINNVITSGTLQGTSVTGLLGNVKDVNVSNCDTSQINYRFARNFPNSTAPYFFGGGLAVQVSGGVFNVNNCIVAIDETEFASRIEYIGSVTSNIDATPTADSFEGTGYAYSQTSLITNQNFFNFTHHLTKVLADITNLDVLKAIAHNLSIGVETGDNAAKLRTKISEYVISNNYTSSEIYEIFDNLDQINGFEISSVDTYISGLVGKYYFWHLEGTNVKYANIKSYIGLYVGQNQGYTFNLDDVKITGTYPLAVYSFLTWDFTNNNYLLTK